LTQEKFVPDPFSFDPLARLYKTGDLVRYSIDGSIEYIGRIDNQVKIRGFRIELGEIETALLTHPDIREVVVVAREDMPGDRRLVAYVALHSERELQIGDLRGFLESRLPNFMLPSAFVWLDRFPLTPNGKIDRRHLPLPDLSAQSAATYVAPRTEMEKEIASIWQEVLQLEKVGMDDNFFDLGGHSLLMVQLAQKLQASLEREISLLEIFKYPTIATFTKYLTAAESATAENSAKSSQQIDDIRAGRNRLKQRLARSSQGSSPQGDADA
jgi:acyl carrier protein